MGGEFKSETELMVPIPESMANELRKRDPRKKRTMTSNGDAGEIGVEVKRYEVVRAKFQPKRTDDLQNNADKYVGGTYDFEASWIIEDGPYKGQWAFCAVFQPPGEYFGWVPECDLEILETIREGLG